MLFVRPVLTQYYRRGKSLGRRDFSSPHSFYNSISHFFFMDLNKEKEAEWSLFTLFQMLTLC